MEVVGGCKTLIGCSPQVSGRRSMSAREYTARRRIQPAAQPSASQGTHNGNVIKICGITNVDDAAKATELGANLIGMILWPHAKRSISVEQAREISSLVTKQGAAAVAVFVNENAQEITRVCDQAGIHIAQLHGDGSRAAIVDLPKDLKTVYVMNVDESGNVCCTPPPRVADWILLDSMQGGSGKTLNWENLRVNWEIMSECGWILAGGLNPDNVVEAITVATPTGVDVSSGVCGPDGLRKDVKLMEEFIQRAKIRFGEEKL